jgi:hypothetical protein
MAAESAGQETVKTARSACLPCRQSKRRCDKKLPSCDLCVRKDVDCSYPERASQNRQALVRQQAKYSATWTAAEPQLLTDGNNAASDLKAIYFLAPNLFKQARLQLPRPEIPVPAEVSALIGDAASARGIANAFFPTVHRWFPIVSKRGFFGHLSNPLAKRQTELSLLLLCMKLISTRPACEDSCSENGRTGMLYWAAKRYHATVEAAGVLSLPVLQAGILIAMYELGQGVYPAAFLSVGACANYGLALGIDRLGLSLLGCDIDESRVSSWNEIEEKRRVWWGVLFCDRCVAI